MSNWNGEGKPPVGTVCEVLNDALNLPEWEVCDILFIGSFTAVYTSESCREMTARCNNLNFRPLKSQADIAREDAIEEMVGLVSDSFSIYDTAATLIDAGYNNRKQGEVVSAEEFQSAMMSQNMNYPAFQWANANYTITKRTDKEDA